MRLEGISGDKSGWCSYLSPTHADDAVYITIGVVKKGDGNSVLAGRDPVAFGGRINLEHMSSGAEDRLLSERDVLTTDQNEKQIQTETQMDMCGSNRKGNTRK